MEIGRLIGIKKFEGERERVYSGMKPVAPISKGFRWRPGIIWKFT